MEKKVIELKDPFLIVCANPAKGTGRVEDSYVVTITRPPDSSYQGYGILLADCIRHVARAFDVGEDEVIDWVNKELRNPTGAIEGGSVH